MKLILFKNNTKEKIGGLMDNVQRFPFKFKEGEILLELQLGRTSYIGYLKGETQIKKIGGENMNLIGQINTWIRSKGEDFIVNKLSHIEIVEKGPGKKTKVIDYAYSLREMVSAVEYHTGFNLSD